MAANVASVPYPAFSVPPLTTSSTHVVSRRRTRLPANSATTYSHNGQSQYLSTAVFDIADAECFLDFYQLILNAKFSGQFVLGGSVYPPGAGPILDQDIQALISHVTIGNAQGLVIEDLFQYNLLASAIGAHSTNPSRKQYDAMSMSSSQFVNSTDTNNIGREALDDSLRTSVSSILSEAYANNYSQTLTPSSNQDIQIQLQQLSFIKHIRYFPLMLMRNGLRLQVEFENPRLAFYHNNMGAYEQSGFPAFYHKPVGNAATNPTTSTIPLGVLIGVHAYATSSKTDGSSSLLFNYKSLEATDVATAANAVQSLFCPLLQRLIPGTSSLELTSSDGAPVAAGTVLGWLITNTGDTAFTLEIFFTPQSPHQVTVTATYGATSFHPSACATRFVNIAGAACGTQMTNFQGSTCGLQPSNLISATQTSTLANTNYSTSGSQSQSVFWNYTLNSVELTLDLVRPSSDVHLQYLNQFKSPMGIPYPFTRTLYYYKTIPGSFPTGTDTTILPFAVRSLKGIMVVITDPYSFGYGSDATVCNFPSKSSFMMAGLIQANLTVGGEQYPLYPLKFESHYQTNHLPEVQALFNVAGLNNFAPSYQPYKLRRDSRIYGLAQGGLGVAAPVLAGGGTATTCTPLTANSKYFLPGYDNGGVIQTTSSVPANIGQIPASGGTSTLYGPWAPGNIIAPAYRDTSRFILGISTMKIDGNFCSGVDTSQAGSVALNLVFDQTNSNRGYLPVRPDGTYSAAPRDRTVHIFGFADAVFTAQNDSCLVRY